MTVFWVGLTGSRTVKDPALVHRPLDMLLAAHPDMGLRHGDCKEGVDAIGDRWTVLRGLPDDRVDRHPAKWRSQGSGAGFIRNDLMVGLRAELRAQMWVAVVDRCAKNGCKDGPFPHGSHGGMHCAKAAVKAGIPLLGPCARCAWVGPLFLPLPSWGRTPWLLCTQDWERYAIARAARSFVDDDDQFDNATDKQMDLSFLTGEAT